MGKLREFKDAKVKNIEEAKGMPSFVLGKDLTPIETLRAIMLNLLR